jgi:hypothetical protein
LPFGFDQKPRVRSDSSDEWAAKDLSDLLQAMATDFPAILRGNLVGIYLRDQKWKPTVAVIARGVT